MREKRETTPTVHATASGISGGAVDPDRANADHVGARHVQLRDSRGRTRPVSAASDESFSASHPALHEYLTLLLVGDKGRLPATLLLFAEDGRFKWCLSDRETSQVCFHAADGVIEGLEGLERAVASGTAVWREKKDYHPKSR